MEEIAWPREKGRIYTWVAEFVDKSHNLGPNKEDEAGSSTIGFTETPSPCFETKDSQHWLCRRLALRKLHEAAGGFQES